MNKNHYKSDLIPDTIVNSIKRNNYECFDKPNQHNTNSNFCKISEGNSKLFAYGDSHLFSLMPALERVAKNNNIELTYTGYSGCAPLLGVYSYREDQNEKNCYELNSKIFNYVKKGNFNKVFLAARWTYYNTGDYTGPKIQHLYTKQKKEISKENTIRTFRYGVRNTFKQYSDANIDVYLMLQVPAQESHPTKIYYKSFLKDKISTSKLNYNSVDFNKSQRNQYLANSIILEESSYFENITIINPHEVMCKNNKCPVGDEYNSYYFDDDHLSMEGSLKLKELIEKNIIN